MCMCHNFYMATNTHSEEMKPQKTYEAVLNIAGTMREQIDLGNFVGTQKIKALCSGIFYKKEQGEDASTLEVGLAIALTQICMEAILDVNVTKFKALEAAAKNLSPMEKLVIRCGLLKAPVLERSAELPEDKFVLNTAARSQMTSLLAI